MRSPLWIFPVLAAALSIATQSVGQDFPKPLPTPCDYSNADKRPGFKRDDPDVFFQWVASQARVSPVAWCLYYAVKNLHKTNNLAFRWPTAHLEKALLAPAGIVDVMTTPANPGALRDNDPLYYGAASPTSPTVMTTIFDVSASTKSYPHGISLEINALGLGGSGGPQASRLDFRGLVFTSSVERKEKVFAYNWKAEVLAISSTAQVTIVWYPTKDPEYIKKIQETFPDALYGKPLPLFGGPLVSSASVRSDPPNIGVAIARIQLAEKDVLTISVPVIRPDQ